MVETTVETLAARLRRARLARGATQGEAARHAGIAPKTLAKWEQGDGQMNALALLKLARFYAVPPAWFFANGEGDGAP